MQPLVYAKNKQYHVKNLGWLIRHAKECQRIEVWGYSRLSPVQQCIMTAYLGEDSFVFQCEWASLTVCREWLRKRRNLAGCQLVWQGVETTCDSPFCNPQ